MLVESVCRCQSEFVDEWGWVYEETDLAFYKNSGVDEGSNGNESGEECGQLKLHDGETEVSDVRGRAADVKT